MAKIKAERPKKQYRYSHAELAQRVDEVLLMLADDLTVLAARGVEAGDISALAALNTAFKALQSDFDLQGLVNLKYAERNNKQDSMQLIISDLRDIAEHAFGVNSVEYSRFNFDGIFVEKLIPFLSKVKTIIDRCTEYNAVMVANGMNPADVAALATLQAELDNLRDAPADAEKERTLKADERVIKGNELYLALKKLCFAGSSYFRLRQFSRSEQYRKLGSSRADGPGNPPEPVEDLAVENGIGSWSPVENATSYAIQVRMPSLTGEYHTIINSTTETQVTLPPQTGDYDVRVLARNAAGLSEPGNEVTVIVPAGLAPPSGVAYSNGVSSWTKSAGAAKTRIEASYDNGVTYNEISVTADEEYPWTPPSGHVILRFRCESADGTVVSSWVVLEVDIP